MLDDIQIKLCTNESRNVIENLIQFYCYDLLQCSQYAHYKFNENGLFEKIPYFDNYWNEDNRYPYLIKKGLLPIGFALVHDITINNKADWKIAEFFILASYRKQGIAKHVVTYILNQHPGLWEISVLKDNIIAKKFWENTFLNASACTYNQYPEFIFFEIEIKK